MSPSHLIVGPGALGRLLAVHLASHHSVRLLGRRPLPETLTLVSPEGERRQRAIPSLTAEELKAAKPAFVHFTTKAYATQAALEAIASRLDPQTPLILWQNGYGVQETLAWEWSGPVLCASTTEGAYVSGKADVVHAGHGQTVIGHLAGKHRALAEALAGTLSNVGLPCEAVNDVRARLWRKLAVNAAINPLAARFRISNGQLRDRPFRPRVEAIIAELVPIMAAEGISEPACGWQAFIWGVIEHTANNRASMLQDVLAGRPTEHEAILGPLLGAAERHHLEIPMLEEQYHALAKRQAQVQ
ncbi:ketopantoate reductase family protein [Pistricoccus aurantiacus]|uniref:ketopantoate reductase family protein n=1 Tax=Pistricoccus aurantiacus TaxID=1883414 RepID=UPI00362FF7D9